MNSHGAIADIFRERLSVPDVSGLIGFIFGILPFVLGSYGFLSYLGMFCGGMCLGLVMRDRTQRAHDRRMRQLAMSQDITRVLASRRCPRCGAITYHPMDIKEGYCGSCHDWT